MTHHESDTMYGDIAVHWAYNYCAQESIWSFGKSVEYHEMRNNGRFS